MLANPFFVVLFGERRLVTNVSMAGMALMMS
jgi:hypothetical protein